MTDAETIIQRAADRFAAPRDDTFLGAVKCMALGVGDIEFRLDMARKAAVDPITSPYTGVSGYAEWFALYRRRSALMQLPGGRVPFSTPAPFQTTRPTGYWVTRFGDIPVVTTSLASKTLAPLKNANIAVLTAELARHGSAVSEARIASVLADAATSAVSVKLFSDDAAVTDTSPAGLANGATVIASGGLDDTNLFDDLIQLIDQMDQPTLFASLPYALRVRAVLNGADDMLPIVVAPEAADSIFAVDRDAVAWAHGDVDIQASEQTSLQMSDSPSSPATMTSMFQTNSIALRVVVPANWEVVRATGVRVLDMVAS